MKNLTKRQRAIMAAWVQADDDFPDKSTEFIIAIVCDRCLCEHSDVIDALVAENEAGPAMTDTPSNGFGFIATRLPHTPAGDAMAPLAELLARRPNTMMPALVGALVAMKGRGWTQTMIETMLKELK